MKTPLCLVSIKRYETYEIMKDMKPMKYKKYIKKLIFTKVALFLIDKNKI